MKLIIKKFTEPLLNWYWEHGRQNLPWQSPYDAYRVWISEIMLQQTQVKTVIPYFLNFMTHFPNIDVLAQAPLDDVLAAWSGLGYYSRARNLHRTAQEVVHKYQGIFPEELTKLQKLPGIGRSTAGAIASLAYEHPTAILDGNVKRVLSRFFMVAGTDKVFEAQLWELAQACMPQKDCRAYTQAIMDLGALCCTTRQPNCALCPLQADCQALHANVVHDYPAKKPKKTRPTRNEQFLLLHSNEQQIYLEQRPLSGIWGGLWCLPTISQETDVHHHLHTTYALTNARTTPFMTYKHSFTHFHLHITAYSIPTILNTALPGSWVSSAAIEQLGLAKPVKDIIQGFLNTREVLT